MDLSYTTVGQRIVLCLTIRHPESSSFGISDIQTFMFLNVQMSVNHILAHVLTS